MMTIDLGSGFGSRLRPRLRARLALMLGAGLAMALAGACRGGGASSKKSAAPGPGEAATVNGQPIGEADVAAAMAAARAENPHQPGVDRPPPDRGAVLAELIDDELAAQRAVAEGLDRDPEYLAELHRLEAQVSTFRRKRLSMLLQRHVVDQVVIDEATARRYFEAEGERLRTTVHVWQILVYDHSTAEALRREIEAGAPFEEVAERAIPGAATRPAGSPPPWDLGYLQWSQIPDQWVSVLDTLAVGDVSPVIDGPRKRAWVLKLVDRRVDPSITFESARPVIEQRLKIERAKKAQADMARQLREGARIQLAPPPSAPSGPGRPTGPGPHAPSPHAPGSVEPGSGPT